jgi:glycosyltransferase involved in cell wall biosynthesis
MVILQLVSSRQYRGAEVFASVLSAGLIKNGHKVLFVGLYPPPKKGLIVHGAQNIDVKNGVKRFFSLSIYKQLKQIIEEYQPDLIQANGSDTLKYAAALKMAFPKIPLVYRLISMPAYWMGNNWLKKIFYRMLYRKVDFVAGVSQAAVDELRELMHVPESKSGVIYRGIQGELFDKWVCRNAILSHFSLPSDAKLLISVGSLSKEKDQAFMLKAMTLLPPNLANQVYLILIGEGPLKADLERLAKELGLGDKLKMPGFRENVGEWIRGADLFLLSSEIEGVPGVVIEAGLQEIPCVALNVGGVAEVIDHAESGILIEPRKLDEFSLAIENLLKEQSLRELLGRNARNTNSRKFSVERAVKAFESLYWDLGKKML